MRGCVGRQIATTNVLIPHPLNPDALFWLMHHRVWFSCPYSYLHMYRDRWHLRRHQYTAVTTKGS